MTLCSRGRRWLQPAWASMGLLSGCTSFQIVAPAQDAITGSPTTVHVAANPQMSQLSVSLDQKDITSKIGVTATDGVGQVAVTPGPHTVAAAATVGSNNPNSWPTPFYATDSKQFCSTQSRPLSKTVTPFAFANSNTWSYGTDRVALQQEVTGNPSDNSSQWWLEDALPSSAANTVGQITWGGAPDCRCMSSDGTLHNAPPMVSCDPTIRRNQNPTDAQRKQLWVGASKLMGNKILYQFGNANSNLCLSDVSGQLTQENCDSTLTDTHQLWTLRDNSTGMLSTDPNPFTIDLF